MHIVEEPKGFNGLFPDYSPVPQGATALALTEQIGSTEWVLPGIIARNGQVATDRVPILGTPEPFKPEGG